MNSPVNEHSTLAAIRARQTQPPKVSELLGAGWLRQLCLDAGADDVGFVEVDRPALAGEHPHIQRAFPRTRSLISFVLRMNRDNVRSPARSVANSEFHHTGDEVNDVARRITAALERAGIRAMNPAMGFPMEADRWGFEADVGRGAQAHRGRGGQGVHRKENRRTERMNSPRYEESLGRMLEGDLSGREAEVRCRIESEPRPAAGLAPASGALGNLVATPGPERSSEAFVNAWKTRLRAETEGADVFPDAVRAQI